MKHEVVIAGGGPTGMMLAGELKLAGVDVAIVERRASAQLVGSRAGGLHARTIEVLDQRGIADRFLAEGQKAQAVAFAGVHFDLSGFPTRHPYSLGLRQKHIERILAGWIDELKVLIYRSIEVTGFAQDDTGVDIQVADALQLQIESAMPRKQLEHVIEEADPRRNGIAALSIDIQSQGDLRLRRIALDDADALVVHGNDA